MPAAPLLQGVLLASAGPRNMAQPMTNSLRQVARKALHRTGLYERLVWTPPHRLWVRWNNPAFEELQRVERRFYRELIPHGSLVLDVGASMGNKSEVFARLGAKVIAVEPDPMCARVLRGRFVLHRHVTVVEAAVSDRQGKLDLFRAAPGNPLNTLSAKWRDEAHRSRSEGVRVSVTTLDALVQQHGHPHFVKLDVEGFELPALRGLSRPVPLVSFEANLPGFLDESLACVDRLLELHHGYRWRTANDFADGWQQSEWIGADELRHVLTSRKANYYEVFARLP